MHINLLFKLKPDSMMRIVLSVIFFMVISNVSYSQITKNLTLLNSKELIEKGIAKFDAENYEEAEALFKEVPVGDTLYYTAQYELAYVYSRQKRYEEALELFKKMLEDKSGEMNYSLIYTQMGIIYSERNQLAKAIEVFDNALSLYPYNYGLHFNKGIVYQKMEDYEKAMQCFEKSLLCYPFHQTSHYQLGISYIKQRCYIPGILALNYAIMIYPSSPVAMNALHTLNDLYVNGFDQYNEDNSYKASDAMYNRNKKYLKLESLVKSNFALNKKFKKKSKINHMIITQNQFVFENLTQNALSKTIEEQLYVPYFQMIVKNKKDYEVFSHLLVSNTNIDEGKVNAKAMKMEKDFDALWSRSLDMLKQVMEKGLGIQNEKPFYYQYNEKYLQAFGGYVLNEKKEKVYEGHWIILDDEGSVLREGKYENGIANGLWKAYDENANVVNEYIMKNDTINETAYVYFSHDKKVEAKQLKMEVPFIDGKINGVRKIYNRSGILIEHSSWLDDWFDGEYLDYYSQGSLNAKANYKKGELTGEFYAYYPNGDLKTKLFYAEKDKEGTAVYYYPNGNIESEGKIMNHIAVGKWNHYYYSGKLNAESFYDNQGKETGKWTYYNRDGILLGETFFENAKKQQELVYALDEKLLYKLMYKNGNLSEIITYQADGSIRNKYTATSDKLFKADIYMIINEMEFLYKQISLNAKGEKHGLQIEYAPHGEIISEMNYINDKLDGNVKEFYPNGNIKSFMQCKSGDYEGVYIRYYANNTVAEEGLFKDNQRLGAWYTYYMDGNLQSLNIYNNDLPVSKTNYFPDGNLSVESFYKHGLLYKMNFYNEKNEIFKTDTFINGNGMLYNYYFNGTPETECKIVAGNFKDTCYWYSFEGKQLHTAFYMEDDVDGILMAYNPIDQQNVKSKLNYVMGKLDGRSVVYHDNTKPYIEADFEYGQSQGLYKVYHENGKLNIEGNYSDDMRNGLFTCYAVDGKTVMYQIYYFNDQPLSYAFMDKNGNISDFKPMVKDKLNIISYYPNGTVSCNINFENGLYQQQYMSYYPNGKLFEETNYKNHFKHGESKSWYENGKLKSSFNYYYGTLNGTCIEYYDNGKIYQETTYVEDNLHGTVKRYNKNGSLIITQEWFYGNRIK